MVKSVCLNLFLCYTLLNTFICSSVTSKSNHVWCSFTRSICTSVHKERSSETWKPSASHRTAFSLHKNGAGWVLTEAETTQKSSFIHTSHERCCYGIWELATRNAIYQAFPARFLFSYGPAATWNKTKGCTHFIFATTSLIAGR